MTVTILTVAGSLRRESLNRKLLEAAARELPDNVELREFDRLKEIPPFDEDDEHGPVPPAVEAFRRAIADVDGLLFATPEYNGSVPGQLKNAIDWASRPYGESAFDGKRAAVIGASPSPYGAAWAQQELRKVLGLAGANVVDGQLPTPEAFRQFDEHGHLIDHDIREGLRGLLAELDASIRSTGVDATAA
jgi:chromate reductase